MSIVRPAIKVKKNEEAVVLNSYDEIKEYIRKKVKKNQKSFNLVIETYPVTDEEVLISQIIKILSPTKVVHSNTFFQTEEVINRRIKDNLTDDRIFGLMSHHKIQDFIDHEKLLKTNIQLRKGFNIVYGFGASLIEKKDLIIYVDLARWEIQKRYRSGEYSNWMGNNAGEDSLRMIKRGYFFEWRIADRFKREIFNNIDFMLDIHDEQNPKMIDYMMYHSMLDQAVNQPFSLVPFFDPGIWGGHWMQETFDVKKDEKNLAWSFNGVPEENSMLFDIEGTQFEIPANNLVYFRPSELLGSKVYGRFGHEFPIRFNFLDTMGGQNLSLQVHPKVSYVQEQFGAHYTQDESYYVMECKKNSVVYLGVKNGVKKKELIQSLKQAETGNESFDDEKYIYNHPMTKHDHYLIPSGTIHSSGKDSVVLEISATPNRFTFKLWDWDRVDFDGLPRPVNINHGEPNIDMYKDADWVNKQLINKFELIDEGDGWIEEKTGLHETEFIETRRHTFRKPVLHKNRSGLNVLNLVEGKEAVISSPSNQFDPFIVQYAQTFIIPANISEYLIAPYGDSEGQELKTMKAFVR
ncbi:class I mannose-6-phosphate isomerase [Vagococcus elongatus]|uniref:Mannose-6-phosphate isomerase n=1 Tax=Vagococcus elongatus TaxID=180344 RepID=A0A430B229_9ENTE|nr:class I mannose-6-phosphate isomerase [Vagococcus elongatus]RSU14393.1 mannose-6-phosphate isomerase [Vagococcus elongatus]